MKPSAHPTQDGLAGQPGRAPGWWPLSRLGEGLVALAARAGLIRRLDGAPAAPDGVVQGRRDVLADWVDWAAQGLGVEAEAVDCPAAELDQLLGRGGPAILLHDETVGRGFLLLLGARGRKARLLGPDLKVVEHDIAELAARLCWRLEAPLADETEALLDAADIPRARRGRVRAGLRRQQLAEVAVGGVWILRPPPSAPFRSQLAQAGALRSAGLLAAAFAVFYAAEILSWRLIGGGALSGRLQIGWLIAWLLLVLTVSPLRMFTGWIEGDLALKVGRLLKRRLIAGAMQMDLEGVARQGVGRLLGRVIETQALESLAFNGGVSVIVAMIELVVAGWILAMGAAPRAHLVGLIGWSALTAFLCAMLHGRLKGWSHQRLEQTNSLVEAMLGHRTRLAQERPWRRDAAEDKAMSGYLSASKAMDHAEALILVGLPSGWLIVGLACMAPAFTGDQRESAVRAAISLGGLLVSQRALAAGAGGVAALARAAVAWRAAADLFHAGAKAPAPRPFISDRQVRRQAADRLVVARDLTYRYGPGSRAVIDALDLEIAADDRILLEGPSGGGKSTLAGLLTSLRTPDSGLLLLNGLDRHTLGEDWRRLAASAPQFHDNHILSGPLAFNLLMGRQWPPSPGDLAEAERVCQALGLGPLLGRMPAGLMQRVGETGWQLSHGERSRIFLARALLQRAELTILDESFAAIDPETLATCLEVALGRTKALMVIAHP